MVVEIMVMLSPMDPMFVKVKYCVALVISLFTLYMQIANYYSYILSPFNGTGTRNSQC